MARAITMVGVVKTTVMVPKEAKVNDRKPAPGRYLVLTSGRGSLHVHDVLCSLG